MLLLLKRSSSRNIRIDPWPRFKSSGCIKQIFLSVSINANGKTRVSLAWCKRHKHRSAIEDATAEDDVANGIANLPRACKAAGHEIVVS